MITLLNRINHLYENIEMGFLTKGQAMTAMRSMKFSILDKFEEGSDNFITCINTLIDVNSLVEDIY